MDQDPTKGVSLSATRRQSVRSRWGRREITVVAAPQAPPVPKPPVIDQTPPPTPKKRKQMPKEVTDNMMPARAAIPMQKIVDAYHENMPTNPRVRAMSETTKGYVKARWNEDKDRQRIEWWHQYFAYCNTCPFLVGKVESRDRKPFVADFQWLVRSTNMEKVVNGKYE